MTDTKSIKSYTPGAESAARKLCRDWTGIPTPADVAEIISRETGDLKLREQNAEMLNALRLATQLLLAVYHSAKEGRFPGLMGKTMYEHIIEFKMLIAKVEGH